MRLGEVVKAPGSSAAISVSLATWLGSDTVSGSPTWAVPTGLSIVGSPSFAANVAIAIVSGGQEGCDYAVTCTVTTAAGVVEVFTTIVQVRSGEADPRLTR